MENEGLGMGSVAERATAQGSPRLLKETSGIARLVFDTPEKSANVLTGEALDRLAEALAEIRTGSEAGEIQGVLVVSEKPSSFIVGADVAAIAAIDDPNEGAQAARAGQTVFRELEQLPVPTVAAIHGVCMGGGTELALACRYRLASDSAKTQIGLPEVQLGILPAWGGTTRLPRLIGPKQALDLLLTGRTVTGRKAKRLGLVDEVLPAEQFLELAEAFLVERIRDGRPPARAARGVGTRLLEDTAPGRRILINFARKQVLERTGGHYPAPLRILEVIGSSLGRPLDQALELEARAAGELIASRISKNLVHVFLLREAAKKGVKTAADAPPREVNRLGVVGAGTMGGGIAQLAAYHGIEVRLKDVRQEAISLALRHASELFEGVVRKRRLSEREADQAMDRISGGLEYVGLGPADLVIEAVVERLDVKRQVLSEVEAKVLDSCVVATNTSSLSVNQMSEALKRPERFLGMHFFNPVHKMPLIEIVRSDRTESSAIATVYALAVRLGKVPVVVRDGPGFLVNRILSPYLNEAGYLLGEGAKIEEIDEAARSFGMPMGPLRLMDEVGIDIVRHAGETLHEAFGPRLAPAPALIQVGETGRLGRKGASGFYRYAGDRDSEVDESIYELIETSATDGASPTPEEIQDRLVLAMINEAARVLSDEIVTSAAELDLAMIMGTGFPPFRGGLLRFADEIHPRALVERLDYWEGQVGPRFSPAPLLRELALEDRGFYEAFPRPSAR